MVMPCSRSAASPSTRSAKSIFSPCVPWRLLSDSSAASWSSKICLVSYSSRPIRVDLPSSTLPQVMKRSSSFCSWLASQARTSSRAADRLVSTRRSITRLRHSRGSGNPCTPSRSKVALLLFLLHAYVLPHVELGPVGQREDSDAFAFGLADIVQRPQLGPLALGVPPVVLVAEAEDALLGSALLLVAPGAAERRVEAVFVERLP